MSHCRQRKIRSASILYSWLKILKSDITLQSQSSDRESDRTDAPITDTVGNEHSRKRVCIQ